MFDLGMIESYVLNLREEGGKCLLSSLPDFSRKDLKKLSLPLLSRCYFSGDDSQEKQRLPSLIKLDIDRSKSIIGNDIFRSKKCEIYSEKEPVYRKTIQLIRSVWPEYFEVIKIVKPRLSLAMVDDPFESASDPIAFGEILYRMDSDCPVKWAEIIVHELGHHYLNMVVTTHDDQDVLNQPWEETKYSAIRNADRPLIGIYHGTFAEACMLGFAFRILSKKGIDKMYREAAFNMINKFEPLFRQDYETVKNNGCLEFDEHILEIIESIRIDLDKFEFQSEKISLVGVG